MENFDFKALTCKVLIVINTLVIVAMCITGYAGWLSPVEWGWLAEAGYAFPVVVFANLLMIVLWTCVKLRYVIIPLFGMLICFPPVRTFFPVNLPAESPENSIRVMSYNTWNWGLSNECLLTEEQKASARFNMIKYIADQQPDIVCLQESGLNWITERDLDSLTKERLPYREVVKQENRNSIVLLSHYPVLSSEQIKYESEGNLSAAFTIDINGRQVIVVNNHLETNSFSTHEKENFSDVIHGNQGRRAMAKESRLVLGKLTSAARIRAPQAEAVASFIRLHAGTPLIVCGDFNDIPLSYTHNKIAKELTDCYVSSAIGPGFSFRKHSMRVRIDNILCSEHFKPYNCRVDDSIDLSDHFPIMCDLELR